MADTSYRAEASRGIITPAKPRGETMITSVKFVNVPTRDQDRALAFYTEKLGFRLVTDQPFGPDRRWIELAITPPLSLSS